MRASAVARACSTRSPCADPTAGEASPGRSSSRALSALRDHGETSAALGVDIENPNQALDLYTSCGFVVDLSGAVYEKAIGRPTNGT